MFLSSVQRSIEIECYNNTYCKRSLLELPVHRKGAQNSCIKLTTRFNNAAQRFLRQKVYWLHLTFTPLRERPNKFLLKLWNGHFSTILPDREEVRMDWSVLGHNCLKIIERPCIACKAKSETVSTSVLVVYVVYMQALNGLSMERYKPMLGLRQGWPKIFQFVDYLSVWVQFSSTSNLNTNFINFQFLFDRTIPRSKKILQLHDMLQY